MGSGRPTIIGKRGVEDVRESRGIIAVGGSGDVSRARREVLKSLGVGQSAVAEEIEVGSRNLTSVFHLHTSGALLPKIRVRVKVMTRLRQAWP